ncbi:hypothetical protein HYG86_17980 [Alkalicella caledoniensis]|uniref:Uncharacterized protein n=1 Tax=Alkalicella caledoniensis TaxID=2731377 RepID=A0A7G9WCW5_ALKCA|nr:hypothetical protein [Alkalicella caledoniensis]QNO16527.1 hypothetical protein HYG86_17980 [Alkalicella caledoniensis]
MGDSKILLAFFEIMFWLFLYLIMWRLLYVGQFVVLLPGLLKALNCRLLNFVAWRSVYVWFIVFRDLYGELWGRFGGSLVKVVILLRIV